MSDNIQPDEVLLAFRVVYQRLLQSVQDALASSTDSNVLARLGDDLDEYRAQVAQHSAIFQENELQVIQTNITMLQEDIRLAYQSALDQSHHGRPTVIERIYTGRPGRPSIQIDPDFLRWAYTLRSTSSISRFLGIGRSTLRENLLEHGIAAPQPTPFVFQENEELSHPDVEHNMSGTHQPEDSEDPGGVSDDFLLDPHPSMFPQLPSNINSQLPIPGDTPQLADGQTPPIASFTGPLSFMTDNELDDIILRLRRNFTRAGITMLHGMLMRLGYRVPRQRIRESLLRIDPVQRIFERIRIRRRVYSVPGPNSLWHHDGQHGLIRWGIVIHGFIDGYSRLITGLRASDNNMGQTVLDLFLHAAGTYGVPSRLRGDHGVENILVAAWIEDFRGTRRGSYIWGRSVHNVRIERLWVDITAQIGASWANAFTDLELHHGLDINSTDHIWLLHHLFLPTLNQQLSFFAESWNHHRLQIRGGPSRSPADMFGFDMLVHGMRGDPLPEEGSSMSEEELEVYGVDWAALRDDQVLQSVRNTTPQREEVTSWVGRTGPPEHLNEVPLVPPVSSASDNLAVFDTTMTEFLQQSGDDVSIPLIWGYGLALARNIYGNMF